MNEPLYVLKYRPDGKGCPYHLSGEFNQPEWEWRNFETKPHEAKITRDYSLRTTDGDLQFIDFDFYGTLAKYVSEQFVALCADLHVNSRQVPLDITYFKGGRPSKSYFVFLPADHLPMLDAEKSVTEVEVIDESGQPMMDRFFPDIPIYRRIEKFVSKDAETPHLFQCVELFSLVCTETFRAQALKRMLRGVEFIRLDDNFVYDPGAGW
ncbi:hypothetical protein [Massilia agri]|uniref:Uncharacterized protein n=1 Tax=Massilia agri TaxID=1886785 RepID=A0ABT2AS60_9BURK|nr:hypothetical protein [Massilia agri]MCS0599087.1 hypothetical protein [Massilia agri]